MNYELEGYGFVEIDDLNLKCNFQVGSEKLFKDFNPDEHYLSGNSLKTFALAIDSKKTFNVTKKESMDIGAFCMSVSVKISEEQLKKMKTCGAAKFIPSELKK